jgi:hypothetical protein
VSVSVSVAVGDGGRRGVGLESAGGGQGECNTRDGSGGTAGGLKAIAHVYLYPRNFLAGFYVLLGSGEPNM